MKTKTILTICLMALATALNAQNFEWVISPGPNSSEYISCNSVRRDVVGNFYALQVFNGTVEFETETETTILTSAGSYDICVLKIDSLGNVI